MLVHQAFRFELDPSDTVASELASSAGAARFAYNWGLALVKARLDERARVAELLGVEGLSRREARALAGSTVEVPWSLPAPRREWNRAKDAVAPWWAANSNRSFGIADDHHVRLPRIGVVRTKEPTTALRRRLEAGAVRVLSATVKQVAGRWYVSFTCEAERAEPSSRKAAAVIGVDVGVRCLAVCSAPVDGVSDQDGRVPNPRHLSRYQRRMTRPQAELSRRHGPAKGHRPSKRWRQTKARSNRCHAKVANARADSLHKLTTALAKGHEVVIIEDLNVAGMTATAKGSGRWRGKAGLNRAILDAAPAELRRQLTYKTRRNRQDGTGSQRPDRTATATRQRVAPRPVLIGSGR
jgi:putative transposase